VAQTERVLANPDPAASADVTRFALTSEPGLAETAPSVAPKSSKGKRA
jgi:hypothetical protein